MRLNEIDGMFDPLGIPHAYYQFPENTKMACPFLVWYIPGSSDLYADNINYGHIAELTVELYTDEKDFTIENQLEDLLTDQGLAWSRSEAYISGEKMWQITYTTEVSINA